MGWLVIPELDSVKVLRTATWALLPLATACPADEAPTQGGSSSDTSATAPGDSSSSAEDAEASADGASSTSDGGSTSLADTTVGDTTTVGMDDDSTTVAMDDGDDTLEDGCWDHRYDIDYYSQEPPPWDPFVCAELTIPCPTVDVAVETQDEWVVDMTPEEIATADANARCVLEQMRDGAIGSYEVHVSEDQGFASSHTRYSVLAEGAVASVHTTYDLEETVAESYRQLRDGSFFEECLAQTELVPLVQCLATPTESSIAGIPAIDPDACVNAEPECPG
jgi:hypothetical protein